MEFNLEEILVWAIPASILVGGFIVGIIFEWIIMKSIRKFAKNTKTKLDDVLVDSFKHAFIIWGVLIGLHFANVYSPYRIPGLEKYLMALATLVSIFVIARMVHGYMIIGLRNLGGRVPTSSLLPNIAKIIVIVVGVVFILQDLGYPIGPLIGALGIGGLAAALAFKDTLENLFSGIQIIVSRKIRPGDYIKLGSGDSGQVVDISWRETTVKDFTNNLLIVPNAQIANSMITNYNLPHNDIYVELLMGVGYESDLDHVENVVRDIAKSVYEEAIGEPMETEAGFYYLGFGDSSIDFKIKIMVKEFGHRMKVQHPLIKTIHKRFMAENINIPYPIRTIDYMNRSAD